MAPISNQSKRRVRFVVALFVAICFASLQTASAITEQVHVHGPSHTDCCTACHAGHLSVVQATVAFDLAPPTVAEWHSPDETPLSTIQFLSAFHPSRAPPA